MTNRTKDTTEQTGWTVWLTGLPASGKTSLAYTLRVALRRRGVNAVILDSDEVRAILTPSPTYTRDERDRFYAALVELAALLTRYHANVIVAATASRRTYRDAARRGLSPFAEVWIRCPIEVCRCRDSKGLYARADAGDITTLPGVGVPYEVPEAPDVIVDSDRQSPETEAERIIEALPFLVSDE